MILLTTTDIYIEKVLQELRYEYMVLDQSNQVGLNGFSFVLNSELQSNWLQNLNHPKLINFIYGTEIVNKNNFKNLEKAYFNIFISESALKKTIESGYGINYSRDLVIGNDHSRFFRSIFETSEAA